MHLLLCPLKSEWQLFEKALLSTGISVQREQDQGRWYFKIPDWSAICCVSGHGKAQTALQTQYWISKFPMTKSIIAFGAAGGLADSLSIGDVLAVTEIVEHDYKELMSVEEPPLFKTQTMDLLPKSDLHFSFKLHNGRLASGDEDIVTSKRAIELRDTTKGVAVAWESAGSFRAAQFNKIPYVEFRGITDLAQGDVTSDFSKNLPIAMTNVAQVIYKLLT